MSIFRDFDMLRNTVDTLLGNFGREGWDTGVGVGEWDPMLDLDVPLLLESSRRGISGEQQARGGKGAQSEEKREERGSSSRAGTQLQTQQQGGHLQPTFKPEQLVRAKVNIEDKENQYIVTAELPGFDKENIHVNISDDNVLRICGEQSKEWKEESKEKKYLRAERTFANFVRNLKLPHNVNKENIKASYVNGVLHVDVPKTKEQTGQKEKQIQIQ